MIALVTSTEVEAHGLHVAFLAFVAILGLVLTVAAVVDARHRNGGRS